MFRRPASVDSYSEPPGAVRRHPCARALLPLIFFGLAAAASSLLASDVTFTYDDAGRLIAADYGGDRQISYRYDANGNLTRRTETVTPVIFADGFESGDFSAWDGVVGRAQASTAQAAEAARGDAAHVDRVKADATQAVPTVAAQTGRTNR